MTIATHRRPTRWRRHSHAAISIDRQWSELIALGYSLTPGSRQRLLVTHAARAVRLALRQQVRDDNTQEPLR